MSWTREERFLALISAQELGKRKIALVKKELMEPLDWSFLVYKAMQGGLAPLLYRHCHDLRLSKFMPKWVEERLKGTYHLTVSQNLKILAFLTDLAKILKDYNVPVIVLQGASLLIDTYKDIGIRPMEDVDLMVSPENRVHFKKILEQMGYSPDPIYPDTYRKGKIYVDLHTDPLASERISSRKLGIDADPKGLWDPAIALFGPEFPIYHLSVYNNLIFLSLHLLKHNLTRLVWFLDIREVIESKSSSFNWEEFVSYCWRVGGNRLILYVFLLLRHLLDMEVPDSALETLGKNRLSTIEKLILKLRLKNEEIGYITQLLWLFLIKQKKIYFILENIFPKKEIMAQIFPSSPHTFRIYVLRLVDLLSHGLYYLFLAIRVIIQGGFVRL